MFWESEEVEEALVQVLYDIGVLPGADMTVECALIKLAFVLGRSDWDLDRKKKVNPPIFPPSHVPSSPLQMLMRSLRGEMTGLIPPSRSLQEKKASCLRPVKAGPNMAGVLQKPQSDAGPLGFLYSAILPKVAKFIRVASGDEAQHLKVLPAALRSSPPSDSPLQGILLPLLMCNAAAEGNEAVLDKLREQGAIVNAADYDNRTPLHEAARNGRTAAVEYLLAYGASVHARSPLPSPVPVL